ncbi:MAG: methylmalonyl Co-A mutase-associated GTPase MeaB [Candidatus Marinimicrobia bacterium]|nr:methylmalonyl Co-A mutase-associated GTPase MeaB [Candidatus Neomarinimicrobiota bacterium]
MLKSIRKKDILSISRTITQIESSNCDKLLSEIYPFTGNAFRIGITGPPGAGKSSITNELITKYRSLNKSVAVIGVDPTSPFTGGALLGDRLRMAKHFSDSGVYIRSMASRGSQGGLSNKSQDVGNILDCAGFDIIIYETVGVGQIELDVMKSSDLVIVVLVPESGDDIQMMKAGLMEIGNIFVINKSDRPGSDKLKTSMQQIFSLKNNIESWENPIVKTSIIENFGLDDLFEQTNNYYYYYKESGLKNVVLKDRYKQQIEDIIIRELQMKFWNKKRKSFLDSIFKRDQKDWPSPVNLLKKIKSK